MWRGELHGWGGVFFLVLKSGGDAAVYGFANHIGSDAAGGSLLDESPGVVVIPRRHLDLSLCIGFFQSQPLASSIQRIAILRQQQVALAVTDEGQAMAHIVAVGGGHAAGPDFAGLMAHNVIADPGGAAGVSDADRAVQRIGFGQQLTLCTIAVGGGLAERVGFGQLVMLVVVGPGSRASQWVGFSKLFF